MTHLYGKVAFVDALLYVGRSSIEIQHALFRFHGCICFHNSNPGNNFKRDIVVNKSENYLLYKAYPCICHTIT